MEIGKGERPLKAFIVMFGIKQKWWGGIISLDTVFRSVHFWVQSTSEHGILMKK